MCYHTPSSAGTGPADDDSERNTEMARTRRIKKEGDAHYHITSRTNGRRFLFEDGKLKTELVSTLWRAAEFCGVGLEAYAAMSNHFHVVAEVMKPESPVGEAELLRRVGVLRGERAKERLAKRWNRLRGAGREADVEKEQGGLRARMHDVSEFVKLFKEEFDRIYKRGREHCGSIWAGRFSSTIIQDGDYLARCKRYVVYNPVRAGIVSQAKDYSWSWCDDEGRDAAYAGAVPGEWCLRRVAQIVAGKVLGSREFVMETVFSLGDRFRAGTGAHPVGDIGHSTHGWRLAS